MYFSLSDGTKDSAGAQMIWQGVRAAMASVCVSKHCFGLQEQVNVLRTCGVTRFTSGSMFWGLPERFEHGLHTL